MKKIQLHDESLTSNPGGDCHQNAEESHSILTTPAGCPVSDDQNSLKAGPRGPTLLEDFVLREKLFHFDHERIPERVVHARGFGVHGFFENYESLAHLTKAHLFQKKGEKTPAFVRFSTVAGNKGSADLARDVRGFAVKLYTQEGNWDIVGNNIPVFFIQDAIKFPDLIHAAKDEPDRGFPQAQTAHDNFWDFVSLTPESMNMIMWIMSDRTIPRSLRFMEGFGVHTFRMINEQGKSTFVKFHWKPKLGMQSVTWDEAVKINGADPDYHRRDLWNAIQNGHFPEWELGLQLFDEEFANTFPFDVLDATKLIPEEEIPITVVGRLVLNRCVDNFFAETEQVAFCTQNIVPGIDFSDDPLLQGRNFSYLDTQIKRLGGPNFSHLPINAPKCPFANFHQDGHMAFFNPKGRVNYHPNSWQQGPRPELKKGFQSYSEDINNTKLRGRSEKFGDHYSQAHQFYISQNKIEQQHIIDALIFELSKVEKQEIRQRMIAHLLNIDTILAKAVATGLGIDSLPNPCEMVREKISLEASDKLSILKNSSNKLTGRQIGIFLTENANATVFNELIEQIKQEGATYTIIAPTIGGVTLNNGSKIQVEQKIGGAPSVLFDSIALIVGNKPPVKANIKLYEFIMDAFINFKYIAYTVEAKDYFIKNAFINLDAGCIMLDKENAVRSFIQQSLNLRFWQRKLN